MLPQLVFLLLTALDLGLTLAQHGQPREPHNFWASLLIAASALIILYLGGFFDEMLGR